MLKAVAERLLGFARHHRGEAYRYGGDEFALLFPRLRQGLLPHLPSLLEPPLVVEGVAVSFSLGVSGGRRRRRRPGNPRATADDLIRLASLASTLAKGRPEKIALGEEVSLASGRAPEATPSPDPGC